MNPAIHGQPNVLVDILGIVTNQPAEIPERLLTELVHEPRERSFISRLTA